MWDVSFYDFVLMNYVSKPCTSVKLALDLIVALHDSVDR